MLKTKVWLLGVKREVRNISLNISPTVFQTMNPFFLDVLGALKNRYRCLGAWRMASGFNQGISGSIANRLTKNICDKYRLLNIANSKHTEYSLNRSSNLSSTVLHGCDPEKYSPDVENSYQRIELGIAKDSVVFAIIARISASGRKGQIDVLEGLRYLAETCEGIPTFDVMLIGGSVESPNPVLEAIENFEPIQGVTIHNIGQVNDVERYYAAIDFTINGRRDAEPFGLSIVESMMMCTPVLAHGLGGPSETVIDGITGWLCHDISPEGWALALSRCLSARNEWKSMGDAARAHCLENLTTTVEVDNWLNVVEEATVICK